MENPGTKVLLPSVNMTVSEMISDFRFSSFEIFKETAYDP